MVRKTYGGGAGGSEVVLVVVEGGGHTWPGREPPSKVLGRSTRNVSANDLRQLVAEHGYAVRNIVPGAEPFPMAADGTGVYSMHVATPRR